MPVTVEVAYTVSIDGSAPWKVSGDLVRVVDGLSFVKVRPWDPQFVRLVVHDFLKLPKGARPSLAQCPGFKEVLRLRNSHVAEFCAEPEPTEPSLFGNTVAKKKAKVTRMNATKLAELREAPAVMEFTVPGVSGCPPLNISAIKPIHPCDDLCVRLDGDTLDHLVAFMRAEGVDIDSLTTKRQYGNGGNAPGVWRNGSAGLIRKLVACDDAPDKKRYQSLNSSNSRSDSDSQALTDDGEPTDPLPLQDGSPSSGHSNE